jgi:hypothetical protein
MAPADKTKQLTILQSQTFTEELKIHLADKETYEEISSSTYNELLTVQKELVAQAIRIYKDPKILNKNASSRYIYCLPKLHKPIEQWRTRLHPKMRPIISDSGSITYGLARHLLPPLQKLERYMNTPITSSIAATFFIQQLNINSPFTSYKLATMDVESLFTRIPQDRLIQIVEILISKSIIDTEERKLYMDFLTKIITCNTFEALNKFYIQKIGVPMGMALSGSLANIYLGYIEKEMEIPPTVPIFVRYVDDGFLLSTLEVDELQEFLDDLSKKYRLNITSTISTFQVNYLDMTIRLSFSSQKIYTFPFTKSIHHPLPLPSEMIQSRRFMDLQIIKSQLLRIWRISNNSIELSHFINNYLQSIPQIYYRHGIFRYLAAIKISTHKWSADIMLCKICLSKTTNGHIFITKVVKLDDKYVSTNLPMNCRSQGIYIIIKYPNENVHFTHIHSLHSLFSFSIIDKLKYLSITPLSFPSSEKLKKFLQQHPIIKFTVPQSTNENIFPCYIHKISKKSNIMYGINSSYKKNMSIGTYFNDYKKIYKSKEDIAASKIS